MDERLALMRDYALNYDFMDDEKTKQMLKKSFDPRHFVYKINVLLLYSDV